VLDPENVGENLGRLVIGEIGGFILGPVVASVMVEVGGIRAPFLAFAVLSVAFLPFVVKLPPDNGERDETAGFPFDLLKSQRLQGGLILVFGYFFLIGAFESVLPVMLVDEGARPTTIGIAFTGFAIPIVLVSTHAGRTADRLGPPRVAIAGMAFSAAVASTYGIIPAVWMLIVLMTLVGFADGYGFIAGQCRARTSPGGCSRPHGCVRGARRCSCGDPCSVVVRRGRQGNGVACRRRHRAHLVDDRRHPPPGNRTDERVRPRRRLDPRRPLPLTLI